MGIQSDYERAPIPLGLSRITLRPDNHLFEQVMTTALWSVRPVVRACLVVAAIDGSPSDKSALPAYPSGWPSGPADGSDRRCSRVPVSVIGWLPLDQTSTITARGR